MSHILRPLNSYKLYLLSRGLLSKLLGLVFNFVSFSSFHMNLNIFQILGAVGFIVADFSLHQRSWMKHTCKFWEQEGEKKNTQKKS